MLEAQLIMPFSYICLTLNWQSVITDFFYDCHAKSVFFVVMWLRFLGSIYITIGQIKSPCLVLRYVGLVPLNCSCILDLCSGALAGVGAKICLYFCFFLPSSLFRDLQ